MVQVAGYRLTVDSGPAVPLVGDKISGSQPTPEFDTGSNSPTDTGAVNYPNTLGVISGKFYYVSNNCHFTPNNPAGCDLSSMQGLADAGIQGVAECADPGHCGLCRAPCHPAPGGTASMSGLHTAFWPRAAEIHETGPGSATPRKRLRHR